MSYEILWHIIITTLWPSWRIIEHSRIAERCHATVSAAECKTHQTNRRQQPSAWPLRDLQDSNRPWMAMGSSWKAIGQSFSYVEKCGKSIDSWDILLGGVLKRLGAARRTGLGPSVQSTHGHLCKLSQKCRRIEINLQRDTNRSSGTNFTFLWSKMWFKNGSSLAVSIHPPRCERKTDWNQQPPRRPYPHC